MVSLNRAEIVSVESLVDNAKRLGITWSLRPATIVSPPVADPTGVPGVFDGDTIIVSLYSLVGPLAIGARVMVMTVPPSGNYVIGHAGGQPADASIDNVETLRFTPVGTLTFNSTSYALITGATQAFTKRADYTRLHVDLKVQGQATTAGAGYFAYVGVATNGPGSEQDVSRYFFDVANVHRAWSADLMMQGAGFQPDAGTYTFQLSAKVGTPGKVLTINPDDLLTATFTEVF